MFHVKHFFIPSGRDGNEAYPLLRPNLINVSLGVKIHLIPGCDHWLSGPKGDVVIKGGSNLLPDDQQRITVPSFKALFSRPQVGMVDKHDKIKMVHLCRLQNIRHRSPTVKRICYVDVNDTRMVV